MAAAQLDIEKGSHFKGRAEATDLGHENLHEMLEIAVLIFVMMTILKPGIHTKAWRCFEEFRERPRHLVPDAKRGRPPPPE